MGEFSGGQRSRFVDLLCELNAEHTREVSELRHELNVMRGELHGWAATVEPSLPNRELRRGGRKMSRNRSLLPPELDQLRLLAVNGDALPSTADGVCRPPSKGKSDQSIDSKDRVGHTKSGSLQLVKEELLLPGVPATVDIISETTCEINGEATLNGDPPEGGGSLFDPDSVLLLVRVISARGLRRADWLPGSASDPYCVVEVTGQKSSRRQTRYIEKTLDPQWHHDFVIPDYTLGSSLTFEVYDKDWGSDDDILGTVVLDGSEFEATGFCGELRLMDSGGYNSFIKVKVTVASPKNITAKLQVSPEWGQRDSKRTVNNSHTVNSHAVSPKVGSKRLVSGQPIREMSNCEHGDVSCSQQLSRITEPFEPTSGVRMGWDVIGTFVLLIELFWIPMQAFDPPQTWPVVTIGWITLLYWTIDMLMAFNTTYYSSQGRSVRNRSLIALRYFRQWFIFDLFLVSLDWIGNAQDAMAASASDSAGAARAAKIARAIRVARLIRLMRFAKLRRLIFTIENLIDSESVMVSFAVFRNIATILTLNHFLACLWFVIGNSSSGWVYQASLENAGFGKQYVISLQWSLSQFTPGSPPLHAATVEERTYHVSVLALGLVVATVFVSSITSAMGAAWAAQRYNHTQFFLLKKYLNQNNVSLDLSARVTRYVECVLELRNKKVPATKVHYLSMLSIPLNGQLQTEINVPFLTVHPFYEAFNEISRMSIQKLCTTGLTTANFAKNDHTLDYPSEAKSMCFNSQGELVYRCMIDGPLYKRASKVEEGQWYSEAALWMQWTYRGQMKALMEVTIISVNVAKFAEIVSAESTLYEHAQEHAVEYVKQAQAEEAFQLGPTDIPLDVMTGRGLRLAGNGDLEDHVLMAKSIQQESDADAVGDVSFTDSETETESCDDEDVGVLK